MADTEIYTMTVDYNVLNHLGLNLYSNVPAVLAEAVANAWDADAEHVSITIDMTQPSITIEDDGSGMSRDDLNRRYLCVGYQRRDEPSGSVTTQFNRPVMGRKGIGKLSLFSVAKTISIRTTKDGETNGLVLDFDEIRKSIDEKNGPYHPRPLDSDEPRISKGTQIVITNLTRRSNSSQVTFLRKRLAQRFSVISPETHFEVSVNGEPITVKDRDYLQKLQYGWFYGDAYANVKDSCPNLENHFDEDGDCGRNGWHVSGWIGTVKEAGDLKNEAGSLNHIVIMARGKLAQEDMLPDFAEGGIYTKYLVGEISADFLDVDGLPDIAASSRQAMMEDDPRFEALRQFLQKELKKIQAHWTTLRNEQGLVRAAQMPAIASWLKELNTDEHAQASKLLGKINQLPMPSEKDRNVLMQHVVLAFENLRYKHNLAALDQVTPENLPTLANVFINLDDIEATLYAQIVRERIQVIEALEAKVESNAREKVIQTYLFQHLWLLDPSWERATGTEYMEKQVAKAFGDLGITYGPDEALGRVDIHYATTSGKHIIIELKRSDRLCSTYELSEQTGKYVLAMQRALDATHRQNEAVEAVCVLGREPPDWQNPRGRELSDGILSAGHARIVFYQQLIENAYEAYKSFLVHHETAGRLGKLIESIDVGSDSATETS
jgi:hypothetical protein